MTNINKLQKYIEAKDRLAILALEASLKAELEQVQKAKLDLYLEALAGEEQAQIDGFVVSYRPQVRNSLDTSKLLDYFLNDKMRVEELFYTSKATKPSLKFKKIK